MSVVEIYNEQIYDLLQTNKPKLKMFDTSDVPLIRGLSELLIENSEDFDDIL